MPDSAVSNDIERIFLLHALLSDEEWCIVRCLRKELLDAIGESKVNVGIIETVLGKLTNAGLLVKEWDKCDTENCPPQHGWKLTEAGIRAALHIAQSRPATPPQRALEPA